MKIYMSETAVEMLKEHCCNISSAIDEGEAELMEKTFAELCQKRLPDGRLEFSRDVFDHIMAELDWTLTAYWEEKKNEE